MSRLTKQLSGFFMLLLLIISFSSVALANQDYATRETVRVGFYSYDGFHVQDETGEKSGYGYDYLQHLAVYANIAYEYSGYEAGWQQVLQELIDGDIDLLGGVQKTQERLSVLDFADLPMGYVSTIVTVKIGNQDEYLESYENWNGMRVGMMIGDAKNESFMRFATEKNISFTPVYFDTNEQLVEELKTGDSIDAIVSGSIRAVTDEYVLKTFDSEKLYFAVKKGDTELLEKINFAMEQLALFDPDLYNQLHNQYYSANTANQLSYTTEELAFIEKMKDTTFQAVINPDIMPLSYFEDGEAKGITAQLTKRVIERSGLHINIIETDSRIAYNDVLSSGQVDIKLDAWHDYSKAEEERFVLTEPYLNTSVSRLVTKNSNRTSGTVAAIRGSNLTTGYVEQRYDAADIVYYDTLEDLIDAVLHGKQDVAYVYVRVGELAVYNDMTGKLMAERVYGVSADFCIAVSEKQNALLLSILNKAVASVSEAEINRIIEQNTDYSTKGFTIIEFFYRNPILIISVLTLFLLLLLLLLGSHNRNYRLALDCQAKILEAAEIDSLTGIFNKESFYREVRNLLDENPGGKYAIVRWDIDHFKVYNDIFGPVEGDRLLRHAGKMIGQTDGIIGAHMEADHFAICLPAALIDETLMIDEIWKQLHYVNPSYHFTPRFGAYLIDDVNLDVHLMCDRALYALRSSKGNAVSTFAWYDDSMRAVAAAEQKLLTEIVHALENDEFGIYLQPQVDQYTGQVVGAEALARWFHPTKGVLAPNVFLDVMENNGLVSKLDYIIWEKAVALVADCNREGKEISVSVNMSRRDIYDPQLLKKLNDLIERYGILRKQLHLEITETAYISNPDQLISVVTQIRQDGYVVEMDDFGSGQSSLNTLKDVPVDIIKLDLKFLSGENDHGSGGGIILNSVVRMAHWLDLGVIAEGVETDTQAEYLRSIGCQFAQGYFYAKPMSITKYIAYIQGHTCAASKQLSVIEERFNNLDFWNPNSQETLIFNTLVGAAAIFEYSDKTLTGIRLNEAYLKAIGVHANEIILAKGKALDYLYEEDRHMVMEALEKAAQTSDEIPFEARWYKYNAANECYWLRVRLRRIAKRGNVVVFYAAAENTTEQRLYEQRQQQLLEQLDTENEINKTIMCRTGLAIFDYDVWKDTYRYVKTLADRSLLEKTFSNYLSSVLAADYLYVDDRAMVYRKFQNVIQHPESGSFEFRALRIEGVLSEFVWYRLYYNPVYDASKSLVRIVGQIEDIQEEKEKQLRIERLTDEMGHIDVVDSEVTNRVFKKLAESGNLHQTIQEVLSALGQHFHFSRVYIIEENEERTTSINTYEWCNEGIEPFQQHLQNVPYEAMGGRESYLASFNEKQTFVVSDVEQLDASTRAILDPQGIQSMLWCKLYHEQDRLSYIGADDCTGPREWTPIVIGTMNAISSFIGTFLQSERHKINADIAENELQACMQQLGKNICRYDIARRTIIRPTEHAAKMGVSTISSNMPDASIKQMGLDDASNEAQQYRAFFDAIHRGEPSGTVELALTNQQAMTTWYRAEFVTIYDHVKKPIRAILAIEDVTARILEKSDLVQQRELLVSAVSKSYSHVLALNLTKDTYSILSIEGKPIYGDYATGNYRTLIMQHMEKVAPEMRTYYDAHITPENLLKAFEEGKKNCRVVTRQLLEDGTYHWVESVIQQVENSQNEDILAILLSRTYDEQKQIEEQLEQALAVTNDELEKQRFNMKLVNDNVLIQTLIYRRNDFSISYIGGNLLASFGYTTAEVEKFQHNGLAGFVLEEDFASMVEACEIANAENQKMIELEYRVWKKNGEIAWVSLRATLSKNYVGTEVYIGALSDITERKKMEEELRNREEIMRLVSTMSDCVVHYFDIQSKTIKAVHDGNCDKYKIAVYRENIPDVLFAEHEIMPESVEEFKRFFAEIYAGQPNGYAKIHYNIPSIQQSRWLDVRFVSMLGEQGKPKAALISYLDITDKHEKELVYERFIANAENDEKRVAYLEADITANTLEKYDGKLFPNMQHLKHWTYEQIIADIVKKRWHAADAKDAIDTFFNRQNMLDAVAKEQYSHQAEWQVTLLEDNTKHWLEIQLQLVTDSYSGHVKAFVLAHDITEEKAERISIRYQAEMDGMTDVYNRATTERLIREYLSKTHTSQNSLLLLIDLDNLKRINDNFGHAEGDRVLKNIAKQLKNHFSNTDIVGRVGGDEFMVLLPHIEDKAEIDASMLSLIDSVAADYVKQNSQLKCTISVGGALTTAKHHDFDTLYWQADKALYTVKQKGKNGYEFYDSEMN